MKVKIKVLKLLAEIYHYIKLELELKCKDEEWFFESERVTILSASLLSSSYSYNVINERRGSF